MLPFGYEWLPPKPSNNYKHVFTSHRQITSVDALHFQDDGGGGGVGVGVVVLLLLLLHLKKHLRQTRRHGFPLETCARYIHFVTPALVG